MGDPNNVTLIFYVVSTCFAFIFLIELVLRILAKGFTFFCDPEDWHWNYFDLISVVGAIIEAVIVTIEVLATDGEAGVSGMSQVRILRFLKTTRLLRFFRISRVLRFVSAL